MGRLDGQAIIVTGASRGIGREMMLRFSEEGAHVALVARNRDRLETAAAESKGNTIVVPADVTQTDDVERAVRKTRDAFGSVDVVVNNAGTGLLVFEDDRRPVHEIAVDEWEKVIDTNLTGVFLCTKHAVPVISETGGGNIINISSGWGKSAAPGLSPYISSKWGLEGLTRAVAEDYAKENININALDPGGRVDTAFWDHLPDSERADLLPPDVVNDAAVSLAAQGSDGVTGESHTAEEWVTHLDSA
jgi:3-oxoacyl-[acyl-carrier protein] reductase